MNDSHEQQSLSYCPSFRTYTINSHIVSLELNTSDDDDDDTDDFEFDVLRDSFPSSSPVYPVFNRDLIRDLGSSDDTSAAGKTVELRKLFIEEDVGDELKGVAPETYCLWAPKTESPSRCMKSSSTGSTRTTAGSKTWRLRNLLRRCKSDGKDGLMLVSDTTPSKSSTKEKSVSLVGSAGRRKSYLPYKQDLLGFFGSPHTLRKINLPPF